MSLRVSGWGSAINAFGVFKAQGTCLVAAMSFSPLGANSTPPNPLAESDGPIQGMGKDRGKRRKERL